MDKISDNGPARKPAEIDWQVAEQNNPNWADLSKRKRSQLAKDEMFHREYHDLANAIMTFKPRNS